MYIRFALQTKDNNSRSRLGILVAAHELRDAYRLEEYAQHSLSRILLWFNRNIVIPPSLGEDGSDRALSWWKPEAVEAVEKMWELTTLLQAHGFNVELLKTTNPGTILYQDDDQVVAIPSPQDRLRARW